MSGINLLFSASVRKQYVFNKMSDWMKSVRRDCCKLGFVQTAAAMYPFGPLNTEVSANMCYVK